jgi:hypothetical protein
MEFTPYRYDGALADLVKVLLNSNQPQEDWRKGTLRKRYWECKRRVWMQACRRVTDVVCDRTLPIY